MPLTLKKTLKTKSGTFKLTTTQDGGWALGFEAEGSVEVSYMVIAKPLALLIGELFDFMESHKQG